MEAVQELKDFKWVILGIFLGGLSFLFAGACFVFIVSAIILYYIVLKFCQEDERSFIVRLFFAGFLTRMLVSLLILVLVFIKTNNIWLTGDSSGIWSRADAFRQYLEGAKTIYWEDPDGSISLQDISNWKPFLSLEEQQYGFSLLTFLFGFLFYIFGPMRFSARMLNFLFGALIGVFTYLVAKEIFNKRTAKLAAILSTFFPSLFAWSLELLKEPAYILLSLIMMWSYFIVVNHRRFYFSLVLLAASLAQSALRTIFGIAGLLPFLLSFFINYKNRFVQMLKKLIFVAILFIITFSFFNKNIAIVKIINSQTQKIITYSRGYVMAGKGNNYRILDDKYYVVDPSRIPEMNLIDFSKAYIKGWIHFLFEPFIWNIKSKLIIILMPQVILWYFLLLMSILGMIVTLRYDWKAAFTIILYIVIFSSMIALASGNIGTIFRHRDMLTPFYLIFSAAGIYYLAGKRFLSKEELSATTNNE